MKHRGLRPAFLFAVICVQVLFQTGAVAGADDQSRSRGDKSRPNIVLIVADDLGWADIGSYGADLHETPHLDQLAQEGVRFTNAYASAPVCTPTRAALMTGKYPARLHMTIWHEASRNPPQNRKLVPPMTEGNLPHKEITIAEVLRSAGYDTTHIGKWHLGDAAHYPENQGFDINIGGTFWGAPPTFFYPYRGAFGRRREPRYVPRLEGGKPGEYLTDRLTDEALKIIDRASEKPFFLYLAYHTVHTPIEAKKRKIAHFRNKLKPGLLHQNATYAAMVSHLDDNVGRVMKKLDERNLTDNTLVIFTSDNGGFINRWRHMDAVTNNSPLRSGKGSLYEGGVRVPMIVRYPGVTRAGTECNELVASMDFYPTFLEALGLSGNEKHNRDVDGVSLLPLLKNPNARLSRDTLYFHYPHYYPTTTPVSAIRSGNWKLIETFETGKAELYNLADDLGERNDLSKSMAKKTSQLRGRLHQWQATVKAQMPTKNRRFKAGR